MLMVHGQQYPFLIDEELFLKEPNSFEIENSCPFTRKCVWKCHLENIIHFVKLQCVNPLRAKLLRENINMYLHFMSFLHTNKTQVAEIPLGVRQRPAYST